MLYRRFSLPCRRRELAAMVLESFWVPVIRVLSRQTDNRSSADIDSTQNSGTAGPYFCMGTAGHYFCIGTAPKYP